MLARETGLDRSTVQRTLRRLEGDGWVIRQRPPIEESRKRARTRYRLAVPTGCTTHLVEGGLGAPRTQNKVHHAPSSDATRCTTHPELGAPRTYGSLSHSRDVTQVTQRARADDKAAAVIEALRKRTGKTIDRHHADLVIKQLLDGRAGIRDPVAYLVSAIAKDPDPMRFVPTYSPPPYRAEEQQ